MKASAWLTVGVLTSFACGMRAVVAETDSPDCVRNAFASVSSGRSGVAIVAKGVYHFGSDEPPLELKGATNAVVKGEGATLVFHGKGPHVVISNCRNVTLRGFRLLECGVTENAGPGLMVSGDGVTVERNVFDRLSGPAVVLSGRCRDVAVRDNQVMDCLGHGGAGVFSIEPGACRSVFVGNRLEQFKATLLAARGAHGIDWSDNEVRWNGNRLALWGHLFAVAGCTDVDIRYDGPRIEEGYPPFGRLPSPAVAVKREYIWPEGQMPDMQPHQVAAKYQETLEKSFRKEDNIRPYVDWYLPMGTNRTGLCLVTVSGGGFACCCDGERLAPAIDRMVRSGTVVADLTYRTPCARGFPPHHSAVQDLRQALKVVRSHASRYGFDQDRIGALGNSAGAKAVAVMATDPANALRFAVLLAPAFVMSDGERGENALGGDGPGVTMVPELSFGPKTCPMCLFQGGDDAYSPFSSIAISRALAAQGVSADLHLFGSRWHGFQGDLNRRGTATGWDRWYDRVEEFLVREGLIDPSVCGNDDVGNPGIGTQVRTFERALWPKGDGKLTWRIPVGRTSDAVQIVISGPGADAVAEALAASGTTVVSLSVKTPGWKDVQRAVRVVHSEAAVQGLDPEHIGFLGVGDFGHLAIFAATSSKRRTYNPIDALDRYPCRLAWAVAVDSEKDHDGVYDVDSCPVLFLSKRPSGSKDSVSLTAWERLRRMGVPSDLHVTPSPVTPDAVVSHLEEFLNDRWPGRKVSRR